MFRTRARCECNGKLYPLDTIDHPCSCGRVYCGTCDVEFTREGYKLSEGFWELVDEVVKLTNPNNKEG